MSKVQACGSSQLPTLLTWGRWCKALTSKLGSSWRSWRRRWVQPHPCSQGQPLHTPDAREVESCDQSGGRLGSAAASWTCDLATHLSFLSELLCPSQTPHLQPQALCKQ